MIKSESRDESQCDEDLSRPSQGTKQVDPEIKAAQEALPIQKRRTELLEALKRNQVLIVIGETGSGKTTQIPQFLKEIGLAEKGRIGCTQLRRMAAKRMAQRVAEERNCKVGEEVGYTVRFENFTGPNTQIQFMTDGILVNECIADRTLSSYSAIIFDESHERNINTDILIGVTRQILGIRQDFKLVLSSATLDVKKFQYFFNAEVFYISGRMFPVEEIYCPAVLNAYVSVAADQVQRINELEDNSGDILVFMTGENDIQKLCELLEMYDCRNNGLYPNLTILPLYAALPWEEQEKIFEPTEKGKRKVVVASNIAETSITVDNICYVVDSGWVKQKVHDHKRRLETLDIVRVSQAQAIQRAGRAGRVAPGKCYRLYSEDDFQKFLPGPAPEILRSSLTEAVLSLKNMGFNDLSEFNFIDAPLTTSLRKAEEELKMLSAIGPDGEMTELGKKMARFPVEPSLAKMLILSEEFCCSEEILTIVALLSAPDIFVRVKKNQRDAADSARAIFKTNDGDLLIMLNAYNAWLAHDKSSDWCKKHFIHCRFLHEAYKIREQLLDTMLKQNMTIKSVSGSKYPSVLRCICSGLVLNVAKLQVGNMYNTRECNACQINFGSVLSRASRLPSWVVYQRIMHTNNRGWLMGVTPVEKNWIDEFTPPSIAPITSEFTTSSSLGKRKMIIDFTSDVPVIDISSL